MQALLWVFKNDSRVSLAKRKCRCWICVFLSAPLFVQFFVDKKLNSPFECSVLRWSTVNWSISAFSSLADPCFSKADGTSRLSSMSDELILSRRFFSITPRRFLRVISWQLSFSMEDGLRWRNSLLLVTQFEAWFNTWYSLLFWGLLGINVITIALGHGALHASRCGWCPCVVVGRWVAVANWRWCQWSWQTCRGRRRVVPVGGRVA